jgi:Lipocalin-like domain
MSRARLRAFVMLLGMLLGIESGPLLGQEAPSLQAQLLGVWHLSRFEAVRSDGSTFVPFGAAVSGQLVYSSNGQMLVAWSGGERRKALDPSRPTPEEIAGWFRGFDAYWGTFEVVPGRGEVTHHVKGAVDPAVVGTDRVRKFELRRDELILTVSPFPCWWELDSHCAPGDLVGLRLIWKR